MYKDECVYCFDTVESPHGINVCLECHYGLSPARGFSGLHTALTGHDSFVNIRKTPVEQRPAKQLKLAIDAQTDSDLWETHTKIVKGKMDIDEAEKRAKIVLESDSYSKQQEIVAWELEIQPCEHSLTLQQEPGTPSDSKKCAQCDLDSNLWLCLSCGCLSCGRPQYGGGGGNGHALAHFETSKHPVAVKLGSITADGHADVFCYACDEDVKDRELKSHLETFGIDLAGLSKTEKSMAELQIEQNAKFDFSMQDQHGSDLQPVSGPGLTGMRNLGNSCYLNSVMQCLFSLPEFASAFPGNNLENAQTIEDPPVDLFCQLSKLQDALNSGDYCQPDPHSEAGFQRGVAPVMLKHLIGKGHPEFATMRQQDAYEFLTHLLSKISEAAKKHAKQDPAELFMFETSRRIQCNKCHSVKYHDQDQENVSIQVPIERVDDGFKPVSFAELMEVESAPEQVELECTVCNDKEPMSTTQGFKTFPKVFVLNVRRFELVNWVPQKVDVPVVVPIQIDLAEYQTRKQPGEQVMPEAGFEVDRTLLDQLVGMGFDYGKANTALEVTGNSSAELAMNWLLLPEDEQAASVGQRSRGGADPEQIATLTSMGFDNVQAEAALKVNGNVEAAIEWLFAGHAEDAANYLETSRKGDLESSKYVLKGIVCHKGGSVHAGHYVAFVRRGDDWYLFNDEKVVRGADIEEMQKFAYLYIFERL